MGEEGRHGGGVRFCFDILTNYTFISFLTSNEKITIFLQYKLWRNETNIVNNFKKIRKKHLSSSKGRRMFDL